MQYREVIARRVYQASMGISIYTGIFSMRGKTVYTLSKKTTSLNHESKRITKYGSAAGVLYIFFRIYICRAYRHFYHRFSWRFSNLDRSLEALQQLRTVRIHCVFCNDFWFAPVAEVNKPPAVFLLRALFRRSLCPHFFKCKNLIP